MVCRQLGYGDAIAAPQAAVFGEGLGPTLLDDVVCDGHEELLTECHHKGWYQHDCGKYKDASVVCAGPLDKRNSKFMPPNL